MHIVLVNREYPPSKRLGGIGSYHYELSQALVKFGHQVTVICASDDTRKAENYIENSVNVIRLAGGDFCINDVEPNCRLKKYYRLFTRYFSYRKKIFQAVRSLRDIDMIEFADFGNEAQYLKTHQFSEVPWVVRLHGPMLFDRSTLHRKKLGISLKKLYEYVTGVMEYSTMKKSDGISSCSQYMADWFFEDSKYLGNIDVIYNFINIDLWKFESGKKLLIENNKYKVFFAGTIVKEKGVVELIEACKILKNQGVDISLTLAGKIGTFGEELRLKVQKENLNFITFLGHTSHDQLKEYYAAADIVCLPSWWESFGLVAIEAMATGALVLGSSTGGMAEIIHEGKDGFLVEPKSAKKLAAKIKIILEAPKEETVSIRMNAIKKVSQDFSEEKAVQQLIAFYQNIIDQKKESK